MRLHSSKFEDQLSSDIHTRFRARPAAIQEARHMKNRRLLSAGWSAYTFIGLMMMMMQLLRFRSDTNFSPVSQILICGWLLALSFLHAGRIWGCLYSSDDLKPLTNLPVSDGLIFRWESFKSLRHTLWFPLYAGLGLLTTQYDWSHPELILLGLVVSWLCCTATAWICFRYVPINYAIYAGVGLLILLFTVFFAAAKVNRQTLIDLIQSTAGFITWLPVGWGTLLTAYDGTTSAALLLLLIGVGTVAWCCLAHAAWRNIGSTYSVLVDICLPDLSTITPASTVSPPVTTPGQAPPIETRLNTDPPTAFWTRLFWNWLTPTEKQAALSAITCDPAWEAGWRRGLKTLGIFCLLIWGVKSTFPGLTQPVMAYGCIFLGVLVLPWGLEFMAVFNNRKQGQLITALHGVLPVDAANLTWAMHKAALIRLIMALPLIWLGGCLYVYSKTGVEASLHFLLQGGWWGLKVWLISLAIQPLVPAAWFMHSGRFPLRRLSTALTVCFIALVALFCLISGFWIAIALQWKHVAIGFLIMLTTSSLVAAICQRIYRKGKLDLIRQPS